MKATEFISARVLESHHTIPFYVAIPHIITICILLYSNNITKPASFKEVDFM